jgi:hypothetical protein
MASWGLRLNRFCGCVYISQNVQRFHEQPLVICRIRLRASDGGRNTGSMYCMGITPFRCGRPPHL